MSFVAVNWAWQQTGLTPHQKLVLLALANRHNPDLGCFPSLRAIATDVNCSKSTVQRALRHLQEAGLIAVEPDTRENGSATSNRYHLAFEGVPTLNTPPSHSDHPPCSQRPPHKQVRNKQLTLKNNMMDTFENLWKQYPVKKGKGAARASFGRALGKVDVERLTERLTDYIASVANADPRYIPHLSTWLNQERWDDENIPVKPTTTEDIINNLFSGGAMGIEKQ